MGFDRVKPPKIADSIAHELEQMVIEGVLKPGDRLPPERELAQQFEVSRPSLREALQKLETLGVVEHRHGSGTYVSDMFAPTITEPMLRLLKRHPETIHDLLDFRRALEGIACHHAARKANDADREILRRRMAVMDQAHERGDVKGEAEADAEFHMSIAEAAHNVFLLHVMRGVFELLRGGIASSRERLYLHAGVRDDLYHQHRKIFEGIIEGDPESAWQAVQGHLKYVGEKLRRIEEDQLREDRSRRRLEKIG